MNNSSKIADKPIAQSRGILSLKPSKEAMTISMAPDPVPPHVMSRAAYNALVSAQQKRSA